jgi:DNA mismatch endonuclease (patch repair protein)
MDIWSKEKRSAVMSQIKGRGNQSTEIRLVRLFRIAGIIGWRRHLLLPGKPDFCFLKAKVAIFVDGCFWHGCPKCYRRPKSNRAFWDAKVKSNIQRDKKSRMNLQKKGFKVIRIFEHQLKNPRPIINRIQKVLENRLPSLTPASPRFAIPGPAR